MQASVLLNEIATHLGNVNIAIPVVSEKTQEEVLLCVTREKHIQLWLTCC